MPGPDMSVWTGRVDTADGPNALRWHQMVKPLAVDSPPGIALIGFACDEGVRRNGGRVGAKDGPRAIRQALANLAWHREHPVYDAGDVVCADSDLEGAQFRLAEAVAGAHRVKQSSADPRWRVTRLRGAPFRALPPRIRMPELGSSTSTNTSI